MNCWLEFTLLPWMESIVKFENGLVPIATASLTFVSLIQGKSRIPRRTGITKGARAPIYDAAPGSGKLFLTTILFPVFD